MALSTEEHTVPESRNATAVQAGPLAPKTKSACEHFQEYGRERPGILALGCLGIGFALGWKLKLW